MIKCLIINNSILRNKRRKNKNLNKNKFKIFKKWWRNKKFQINNKSKKKELKVNHKNNSI